MCDPVFFPRILTSVKEEINRSSRVHICTCISLYAYMYTYRYIHIHVNMHKQANVHVCVDMLECATQLNSMGGLIYVYIYIYM